MNVSGAKIARLVIAATLAIGFASVVPAAQPGAQGGLEFPDSQKSGPTRLEGCDVVRKKGKGTDCIWEVRLQCDQNGKNCIVECTLSCKPATQGPRG